MSGQTSETENKTKLLEAQDALNRGDPVEMLSALFDSFFLDGLAKRLQKRWDDSLPSAEIDECIAKAVDSAIDAASKGKGVQNLGAWLWKVSINIAETKWRQDYRLRQEPKEDLTAVFQKEHIFERIEREKLEDARRKEAIRAAQKLLPKVGEGKIRDVMELIIDAAMNEIPDLPSSAIAEPLGISNDAARSLTSRGLRRLRRLAEQEGFVMPEDFPETETEYDN